MKKYLLALLLTSIGVNANDASIDEICFTSSDAKAIKLRMFWVATQGWSGGYVQYGEKKQKISILQTKRTEEFLVEGRPPAVESQWVEIIDGKTNGFYLLRYQGAVIGDFSYKNKAGKQFKFVKSNNSYDDCFM